MVERSLGEETSARRCQLHGQHRFANAEAADLWNALGAVSKKDVPGSSSRYLPMGYP